MSDVETPMSTITPLRPVALMAAHVAWRSFGFPPSQTRPEGRRESEGLGGVGVAVAVAVVLAVRARALVSDWCGEGEDSKRSGENELGEHHGFCERSS